MKMSAFDLLIALDGNGLNGFEGFGGIARLRCDPAAERFDIKVRYFDGLAGGHATQLNPSGTVGFLGNLSQTLLFYDPRTLEEISRCSTLRFCAPDTFFSSQTHVLWLDDRSFVTTLGDAFWKFDLHDLHHPIRLGAHGVTVPHALKRTPSGRYLCYGAMDHDERGFANQVGIFDLRDHTHRIVKLPATAWHLGMHPTKDVFYAPTQRCAPQDGSWVEYTLAHFKNYLFEIDAERAEVTRHLTIPKDLPGALTSDVVVTEDEVLYNACASGSIIAVKLKDFREPRWVDERASLWDSVKAARTVWSNLVESASRANIPGQPHVLLKALRATRFSAVDGSYGLQRSPDGRWLLSAHRGLNEVRVYEYPSLKLHRRVPFPSIREFFPQHFGLLDDPRLGFHHTALLANLSAR
ncbi:MAG: hypothetical protein QM817_05730 [Archangium sp.]